MLMPCPQCGMVVERTELPFHIREVHGPRRSNNAPVEPARPTAAPRQAWKTRAAPPTHDVREDRKSFKLAIQNLVHEFDTLPSQASHECSNSVEDIPVLGALYAYTFTHLKLCAPNKESLLDDLENLKVGWVRDGDACILDLKTMMDGLNCILRKSQVERHICNTRLVNEHRLHDLDIHNIAALIVEYTTPEEHAHVFYHMAEDKAQYMVDTLQNLLVLQSERIEGYRKDLLNAMMRLSRKSGRFPQSLRLSHIRDLKETDLSGGFGVISRGKLNHRVVAVKKMKVGGRTPKQFLKDFCNEAVVWRHAQHPNCLPFYGVYVLTNEGSTLCLVSPWMTNGHVRDYLRTRPHTDRLPLVLDVACGLEYLHSMQPIVIHGDLKGANILITSSGRACLADFGIATVRDSHGQMTTTAFNPGGTDPFMAPELLRPENNFDVKNLDKCDMYAFGCVCYEIYTGKVPFHKKPSFIIIPLVLNGERPERPTESLYVRQGLDDDMWNFIGTLWEHDPTVRPTAADACEWISSKMLSKGKTPVRPQSTEVEWDVRFLADATVTVAAEDPFTLEHT